MSKYIITGHAEFKMNLSGEFVAEVMDFEEIIRKRTRLQEMAVRSEEIMIILYVNINHTFLGHKVVLVSDIR